MTLVLERAKQKQRHINTIRIFIRNRVVNKGVLYYIRFTVYCIISIIGPVTITITIVTIPIANNTNNTIDYNRK